MTRTNASCNSFVLEDEAEKVGEDVEVNEMIRNLRLIQQFNEYLQREMEKVTMRVARALLAIRADLFANIVRCGLLSVSNVASSDQRRRRSALREMIEEL